MGSIIGYVLAYFSYRQYYPSLASPYSHRPYSPRVGRDDDEQEGLPTHTHDRTPQGNRSHQPSEDGNEEVELADETVRKPGPSHLSDAWREDGTGYRDPLATRQ